MSEEKNFTLNRPWCLLWQILNAFRCPLFLYHHQLWINVSLHTLVQGPEVQYFLPQIRVDLITTLSILFNGVTVNVAGLWWGYRKGRGRAMSCVFTTISTLPCLSRNEFSHTSPFLSQCINPQAEGGILTENKTCPSLATESDIRLTFQPCPPPWQPLCSSLASSAFQHSANA